MRLAAVAVVLAVRAAQAGPAAHKPSVAVAGETAIELFETAGDALTRVRTVPLEHVHGLAWDPDGTLWALDAESRIWRLEAGATRARLQPAPKAPHDQRPRFSRELELYESADGHATIELCDDEGDYNDAMMCLASFHGPLATGTLVRGRGDRAKEVAAPAGYAVALDVPVDPKTQHTIGWFLACTAPGAKPVRIFAADKLVQIFESRWISADPPVIAASIIHDTDSAAEWRAIPACDPAHSVTIATIASHLDDPVVGPPGIWASRKAGWTVWRGMKPLATFAKAVTIALARP